MARHREMVTLLFPPMPPPLVQRMLLLSAPTSSRNSWSVEGGLTWQTM
jgi:hypothetical protein